MAKGVVGDVFDRLIRWLLIVDVLTPIHARETLLYCTPFFLSIHDHNKNIN